MCIAWYNIFDSYDSKPELLEIGAGKNDQFVANRNGWPYAFEHWLKTVGIRNGQTLTSMDLYALTAYKTDWEREGIKTPIYYSRAFQDALEKERLAPAKSNPPKTISLTENTMDFEKSDFENAGRFLKTLFAPYERGWIELRCIRFAHNESEAAGQGLASYGPVDARGVRTWRKCFPLAETIFDHGQLWDMAKAAASNLYDVYLGVLPRGVGEGRTRKDAIYEAGCIWAELDFDKQGGETDTMKKAKEAGPDILVRSGGGVHCYWMMTTPLSLDAETRLRFEMSVRARQDKLKTDRTHDCTRILRMPGTFNHKNKEPRKVELLQCP